MKIVQDSQKNNEFEEIEKKLFEKISTLKNWEFVGFASYARSYTHYTHFSTEK